jgi:hypothetical protein
MSMVQIYGRKKSMEIIMKLDNYELSTIHYTISYYIDNANLEEDENEWLNLLKEKVDSIMVSQAKYDMECG